MTSKQIEKEFKRIDHELIENRPNISGPYPDKIVKRRELLLLAQAALNNIIGAKQDKNMKKEKFYEEIYQKITDYYYNYN